LLGSADINPKRRGLQEVLEMHYSVSTAKLLACSNSRRRDKMKRFALAIALACMVSGSALAGEVHSGGAPAPGETPTTDTQSSGQIPLVPGQIPTVQGQMPMVEALMAILGLAF
jgi:hypothetical protein